MTLNSDFHQAEIASAYNTHLKEIKKLASDPIEALVKQLNTACQDVKTINSRGNRVEEGLETKFPHGLSAGRRAGGDSNRFLSSHFWESNTTVCLTGACGLMIHFLLIPPLLIYSFPQGRTEMQCQKPTEALELLAHTDIFPPEALLLLGRKTDVLACVDIPVNSCLTLVVNSLRPCPFILR